MTTRNTTQQQDKVMDNTKEIRLIIKHNTMGGSGRFDAETAIPQLQDLMKKAEQNGVAWSIKKIDELHMTPNSFGKDNDRLFKGIKNTIRNDYELLTGVDPAPDYPVKVELTNKEEK